MLAMGKETTFSEICPYVSEMYTLMTKYVCMQLTSLIVQGSS